LKAVVMCQAVSTTLIMTVTDLWTGMKRLVASGAEEGVG